MSETKANRRSVINCLLVFIFLLGCQSAFTQTGTSDKLTTPTRIISCAPNLTEMLFALGAGDSVIGVTRYCNFPEEAKERPNYGDLYNPSLEAMVAARPDLIVLLPGNDKVLSYFNDKPHISILQTINPDSVTEIMQTLQTVSEAVGKEEDAHALNQETENKLEQIEKKYAQFTRKKVLLVIGREQGTLANLYAAGAETYLTELLNIVNAENVVQDKALGDYPVLSREALIKMNPDIIIETHHPAATNDQQREIEKAWQTLPMISAVRNKRILILTDKHLLVPGPFLERDAQTLADLIHGKEQ